MGGFSSAWCFLTVLGRSSTPDARTFAWFPVVGGILGGLLAATWWGADTLWSPLVAAGIVVAVDLALTGMLHVDGLADSADGLLPHLDRERRLEVMRRPDVGAFALGVVPLVLGLRWAALAAAPVEPLALVALWMASRTAAALVPSLVPYARSEGLATAFLGRRHLVVTAWTVPVMIVAWLASGASGVLAVVVLLATVSAVVGVARRRLGGFTGDVLGAAIILCETVGLLALAAAP